MEKAERINQWLKGKVIVPNGAKLSSVSRNAETSSPTIFSAKLNFSLPSGKRSKRKKQIQPNSLEWKMNITNEENGCITLTLSEDNHIFFSGSLRSDSSSMKELLEKGESLGSIHFQRNQSVEEFESAWLTVMEKIATFNLNLHTPRPEEESPVKQEVLEESLVA